MSPSDDDKVVPFKRPAESNEAAKNQAPIKEEEQLVWKCSCGCLLFWLYPTGPVCSECEQLATSWMNWK